MIRGYIRVSTQRQTQGTSLEDQKRLLKEKGCDVFYEDICTGTVMDRPNFKRLCNDVLPGDVVMITKMDRIARTETEAYELVMNWVEQGVSVHILNLGLVENTSTGRLILHIMLAFSEFERDMIRERMQAGRAYKRATDPTYREGRRPKFSKQQMDHAIDLLRNHSFTEVASMTGISRATLTREARKRGFRKSEI